MNLWPFFNFYGAKWRVALRYPPPRSNSIIEPFAGAAGYALRYHERCVTLVERDATIAALWSYLCRVSPSEVRAIPLLQADETIDDLGGVAEEARSLVGFWLNKGVSSPRRSPSAWMRSGIRPKSFWGVEIRERIASQVEAIRHWRVICGEHRAAPDVEATWFVDPPYEQAGRWYRHVIDDYVALAGWCLSRRGHLIVCEQQGASWLPFEPFCVTKANESRTGGKKSREAVFMRGGP